MMPKFKYLAILMIGFFSLNLKAQLKCRERLIQEASRVDSIEYSTGTGFLINNEGYIATNRHVIERSKDLYVTLSISGKKIERKAKIIGYSNFDDLALLKIDLANLFTSAIPYSFKKEPLNLGSKIYTMGYPDPSYMGSNIKLTDGLINATTGFQDSENEYQISAPIQGGNSGSPMFDSDGFIRGVIVASYTRGQNVNYSIKGENLIELLDSYKVKYNTNKPSLAFNTNLNSIQSRICMITNTSIKTYYNEFNTSMLNPNDNSRNMMTRSSISNSEYFDCFKNNPYAAFGLSIGTKERDWRDAIDPEKGFSRLEEQIIYRARFLNANGFNGLDAKVFLSQLFEYGAFENIIEENNNNFDFSSDEIDFTWFNEYVNPNTFNFLDDYYWATINQYGNYEPYKLMELDEFIDYLLAKNNEFKNQTVIRDFKGGLINKDYQLESTHQNLGNLLQYKLNLIYITEDYFLVEDDKCIMFKLIEELLKPDQIWVTPPSCN
jgi:hypothetical protein